MRALNRKMEKAQAERAKQYEKELDALNKELEALRRRVGPSICYSIRSSLSIRPAKIKFSVRPFPFSPYLRDTLKISPALKVSALHRNFHDIVLLASMK